MKDSSLSLRMTAKNTELEQKQAFDPLDMNNYKVEKLPKMEKSGFEKWMARLGGPIAALVYHHGMLKKFIESELYISLDKKASVTIGNNKVGVIKEGFDFISKSRTPAVVMNMRDRASSVEDESRIFEEKVMLYRKHIIMDNAEVPIDTMDGDDSLTTYSIQKIYHVHIIFQLQHDGEVEYHQFRITMTRNCVQEIDEI